MSQTLCLGNCYQKRISIHIECLESICMDSFASCVTGLCFWLWAPVTVAFQEIHVSFLRDNGRICVRVCWIMRPFKTLNIKFKINAKTATYVTCSADRWELFINLIPLLIPDWHEIASRQDVTRARPYKWGSCDSWGLLKSQNDTWKFMLRPCVSYNRNTRV